MSRGQDGKTINDTNPATRSRLSDEDLLALVPRRSGSREIKVGLFVLIGVLATLVALLTLTDAGLFRGRYYVTTLVADAGGLRKGDPVQMRGVNIGRVRGFHIGPRGVDVTMELDGEYEIPSDSRVQFRSSGLLGGLTAEVVPGRAEEALGNGDRLPGIAAGKDIFDTADQIGTHADTVLGRIEALLSPQTIGAVGQSTLELQALLTELSALARQQRSELATLTTSLQRSAAGLERTTNAPELQRTVARLDSISARLDQTVASLGRSSGSLEVVLGRLERGEGTLGKLSQDEALYANSTQAAAELRQLVADIRANPRKYLSVSVF